MVDTVERDDLREHRSSAEQSEDQNGSEAIQEDRDHDNKPRRRWPLPPFSLPSSPPLPGVLSCYDRIVMTGTLPQVCYAAGYDKLSFDAQAFRFSITRALPSRCAIAIRARAAELVAAPGIEIEHLAKAHIRKEDVVAKVIARRGDHPGLVHVISAMEACASYKPWHDKASGRTFLKPDAASACTTTFTSSIRWSACVICGCRPGVPFRLQFYCNGHGWLARRLTLPGSALPWPTMPFVRIEDWEAAQQLADAASSLSNCTRRWITSPDCAARS